MDAIIYFMETNVSFNLREPNSEKPTSIFLVCRINRKQIKINIGCQYNILPKHWDKESQSALVSNSFEKIYIEQNTEINKRIKECRTLFNEWKNYIAENTNLLYDSETLLRNYINGKANSLESSPIDWFHHYIESICTAKQTSKTQYERHLKVFEAFLKEKNIKLNSFSQFTYDIMKKFELHLIDKGEMVRTINDKMTVLILLLNAAENHSLIDLNKNRINKYKKLENKLKDEPKEYLTEEEIDKIYQLKLTGRKKIVRDIFIVQCHLGQRISDMSLETAIIREDEIELIQKKTSQSVTIPLLTPIVKEILSEYNYSFPHNIVTDRVNLNGTIKEIVKEAGINEICMEKKQIGTQIMVSKKEKWKLITTHTARHSFITNMLLRGHSPELIKKITGHKTDSAFQIYNNITSRDASRQVRKKELADKEQEKNKSIEKASFIEEKQSQIDRGKESNLWKSKLKIKEYLVRHLEKAKEKEIQERNPLMYKFYLSLMEYEDFIDSMTKYFHDRIHNYSDKSDLEYEMNFAINKVIEDKTGIIYKQMYEILFDIKNELE